MIEPHVSESSEEDEKTDLSSKASSDGASNVDDGDLLTSEIDAYG
jgi:hypothetical protein